MPNSNRGPVDSSLTKTFHVLFMILFAGWLCLLALTLRVNGAANSTAELPLPRTGLAIMGATTVLTGLLLGIRESGISSRKIIQCGRKLSPYLIVVSFIAVVGAPAYGYVFEHGTQTVSQIVRDKDFVDGFESGDFTAWSGVAYTSRGTVRVVSSPSLIGSFSGEFDVVSGTITGRAYVYEDLPRVDELYMNAYVYIADGLPLAYGENMWFIQLLAPDSKRLASFGIRADSSGSHWAVQLGNYPCDLAPSSIPLPEEGKWYNLEAYYTQTSMDKTIFLAVDGVDAVSLSQNTSPSSIMGVRFGLCYYASASSARINVDNVMVER